MICTTLTGTWGDFGSGKTTELVSWGWKGYNAGVDVYANFHLKFPFKPLTLDDLLSFRIENAIILNDEGYLLADGRETQSINNKDFANFVMQSRKRNVHIFWSFQFRSDLEVKIREKAHWYIVAEKNPTHFVYDILKRDHSLNALVTGATLNYVKTRAIAKQYLKPIQDLFDTNAVVSVQEAKEAKIEYRIRQKELERKLKEKVTKEMREKEIRDTIGKPPLPEKGKRKVQRIPPLPGGYDTA